MHRVPAHQQSVCLFILLAVAVPGAADEADTRYPVPATSDRDDTLRLVQEVFKQDYVDADTDVERAALAKKMVEMARRTVDDPAGRFVLLRIARDIGIRIGDVETVKLAVHQMAADYQVDGLEVELDALEKVSRTPQPHANRQALLVRLDAICNAALAAEQFAAAKKAASLGTSAATELRDNETRQAWQARDEQVRRLTERFARIQQALAALQADPDDPNANLTVGQYRCFLRGDWQTGLPLLARSADAQLKTLAEQELNDDATTDHGLRLGDAWWDVAGTREAEDRVAMMRRAAYWYTRALPHQTGLGQRRLQKRLSETAQLPSLLWPATFGLADLLNRAEPARNWKDYFDLSQVKVFDGYVRIPPTPSQKRARGYNPKATLTSKRTYDTPLEITLVARTSGNSIRLKALGGLVIWNWENDKKMLVIREPPNYESIRHPTVPLQPN